MLSGETETARTLADWFDFLIALLEFHIHAHGDYSWYVTALAVLTTATLTYLCIRVCRRVRVGITECGECGEPVADGGALTCSICGRDFREAGLVSPLQRQPIPFTAFAVLWTLCLPLPLLLATQIAIKSGPRLHRPSASMSLTPVDQAMAYNRLELSLKPTEAVLFWSKQRYERIEVDFEKFESTPTSTGTSWSLSPRETIEVQYDSQGHPKSLSHVVNSTVCWADAPTPAAVPASSDAFLRAVFEQNLDIVSPTARARYQELYRVIETAPATRFKTPSLEHFYIDEVRAWDDAEPMSWFVNIVLVTAALLWPAGIIGYASIVMRRRHRSTARKAHP